MRFRSRLRWSVAAAVPVAGLLAVGLSVAPGQASVAHSAAGAAHTITLKSGAGKAAFKGTIKLSQLPKATPKTARQAAVPLPGVDRPLKSKAQLAAYRHFVLTNPGKLPKGTAQPAPSKIAPSFLSSNEQIPALLRSGVGIDYTQSGCGCTPPDQALATNGGQVAEGVNNLLEVYNSTLGTVYGPYTAQAFFAPVYHSGDFFSDPQITYDAARQRWLVAWLEIQPAGASAPDYIDLAVSGSANVNGTWYEYQIPSSASGATDFCDYPTMGYNVSAEWIACTSFDTSGGAFTGNRVFGFPLSKMDTGAPMPYVYFYNIPTPASSTGAYRLSPAIEDGTPQGEFITASDAGFGVTSSSLTLCAITKTGVIASGGIPDATCDYNTMPLAYDDPISADQPGNPGTVYPGIGTKQIAYRDGRLWVAMPVTLSCSGNTEDGIWWADFVPQLTPLSSGFPQSVNGIAYPENAYWCFSGDTDSYMPTIEPDSEGSAVLTMNLSNDTSIYPSLAYTGRSATDPVNTMGGVGASAYYAVGSSVNLTGRYGDYSACALAPGGATRGFEWCAGEFGGSDVWNTQIAHLETQ